LNGRLISGFFSVCQVKEMDGRTCVCCVLYQWAGGDRVTRKKTTFLFDFICFLFLFGVGEAEEEIRKAIPIFSFVWRFHRLQQTHINPSRSNPFSVYVTCKAALEAGLCTL
jgi:hypothetical protein